ncbi:MAG: hypothetical protein KZQ88_18705 [Candidatus Thiodiazotropha sp. (ex Dulcina madagascariensis)]|nr:hypothetical protein [Candidatus Thiodiazotropha sp. (ex Dulcina madagascariensis)]MCU7926632.1 hypothetical protein [Candidatus Thiodiazotropha sp. (ex Dulcina madagascariensis)]
MKWLFFILLLANLGLFLWIYPQESRVDDTRRMLADVGELKLFREIAEQSAADADPEISMPVEDAQVEDQPEEPMHTEEQSPSQASEALPSPLEVFTAAQVVQEPPPPPSPTCSTVGFLESRTDAELASVRLRALGLKPELQSETRNEQAGFWVLIPPQPNRRKAIEIADSLEKAGIADLWRFTSGELVHAISLGLFRDEERAAARKIEIAKLGYEPVIKPRYRQKTRYWLHFQMSDPPPATKEGWDSLLADFPGLEKKAVDCP